MRAYRIEDWQDFVVGRMIESDQGQIRWHCVYARAGFDATLDTLLDGLAAGRFRKVEVYG
jgi:hypothetical protein